MYGAWFGLNIDLYSGGVVACRPRIMVHIGTSVLDNNVSGGVHSISICVFIFIQRNISQIVFMFCKSSYFLVY